MNQFVSRQEWLRKTARKPNHRPNRRRCFAHWSVSGQTRNPHGALMGGKGTADLFLAITSNYKITGFDVLTDYGVFDFFKNPDIPRAIQDYGTQGETSHPLPSSRADCRMPAGKPWMVSSVQKQTGATKEPPRAET